MKLIELPIVVESGVRRLLLCMSLSMLLVVDVHTTSELYKGMPMIEHGLIN